MRRFISLAATLGLLFPAGASAASTPDRAADEAQLRLIKTERWPAFYRSQDTEGLGAFLAESFVSIGPEGEAATRTDALADVAASAWMPENFSYTILRLDWHGPDLVTITGRGESDRTDEKGAPCRHVYYSSNLLKRASDAPLGWQALTSHVSGVSCSA